MGGGNTKKNRRKVLKNSPVLLGTTTSQKKHERERVQTAVLRLISPSNESYMAKLKELNLETLKDMRKKLSEKFAEKYVKIKPNKKMFNLHKKTHRKKFRHNNKYTIQNVKTVRMQKSAIINMRKHLNK